MAGIAKPYRMSCGCEHVPGEGWTQCDAHRRKEEAEKKLEGLVGEPVCPGCDMDARRQKCAFEQGGACPRHPVADVWRRLVDTLAKYLEMKEECEE